jgi:hypothetical protein
MSIINHLKNSDIIIIKRNNGIDMYQKITDREINIIIKVILKRLGSPSNKNTSKSTNNIRMNAIFFKV